MQAANEDTRSALIQSGKQEFLKHGFDRASLRTICKNASVTTGAFYSNFERKESLFIAIVEPVLESLEQGFRGFPSSSTADFKAAAEAERSLILFARSHRDELRLLLTCAQGTRYEGFRDHLVNDLLYPACQSLLDHDAGYAVDPDLVRVLLRMKFTEYADLVFGNYSEEQIRRLASHLSLFSEGGFRNMLDHMRAERA